MESAERDTHPYAAADTRAPSLLANAAACPSASRSARGSASILDSLMTRQPFASVSCSTAATSIGECAAHRLPGARIAPPLGIGPIGFNIWRSGKEDRAIGKRWMDVRAMRTDGGRCRRAYRLRLRRALPAQLLARICALMISRDDRRSVRDRRADTVAVVA